jgi:XrtJ-associated TM-motif-TM protein
MKKTLLLATLTLSLLGARPAYAQIGGCDDSPENPTLVLSGLAGGAFAVSSLLNRVRIRRKIMGPRAH